MKQVTTTTNSKKVKFNKDITIIDVESWKSYNKEQTSLDISDDEDDNIKTKNKKKKGIKNGNRKDNISCACILI